MSFIVEASKELADLLFSGDFIEPEKEVGPDEEVIGVMNNDLRALFTLFCRYADRLKDHVDTCLQQKEGDAFKSTFASMKEANLSVEILTRIFRKELFEAFPGEKALAVCKGFKVVRVEPQLGFTITLDMLERKGSCD